MGKRLTKLRARYGTLFILFSFFLVSAILIFVFYKYLLVFIPTDWSWFENYPRRRRNNNLRQVLALILGVFSTISLLRHYFSLQRRLRKKPMPTCPEPLQLSREDIAKLRDAQRGIETETKGIKRFAYKLNWKFMMVEQFAKPRKTVSWNGFMLALYGATLALWPTSILSQKYYGIDFKDLGMLSFWIWAGFVFVLISIQQIKR
ncbi:MAG: hypothetical protein ACXWRZ_12575 [Bdellovibrio sp.]